MNDLGKILADFFSWERWIAIGMGVAALHTYQYHPNLAIVLLSICCVTYGYAAQNTDKLRREIGSS